MIHVMNLHPDTSNIDDPLPYNVRLDREAPEVEIEYWVKELLLYQSDYQILNDVGVS